MVVKTKQQSAKSSASKAALEALDPQTTEPNIYRKRVEEAKREYLTLKQSIESELKIRASYSELLSKLVSKQQDEARIVEGALKDSEFALDQIAKMEENLQSGAPVYEPTQDDEYDPFAGTEDNSANGMFSNVEPLPDYPPKEGVLVRSLSIRSLQLTRI